MDSEKFRRVVEIVKSMNSAGASSMEIENNLREMGISQADIDLVLSRAKPAPTPGDVREMIKKIDTQKHIEPLVRKAEEHKEDIGEVKEGVDDIRAGLEEHASALDEIAGGVKEQKFHLEDIRQSLSKLHDKHEETQSVNMAVNYAELKEIKEALADLKAAISALRDLDEKILKTNREVLLGLKK